jgi:hypothetical protein
MLCGAEGAPYVAATDLLVLIGKKETNKENTTKNLNGLRLASVFMVFTEPRSDYPLGYLLVKQ